MTYTVSTHEKTFLNYSWSKAIELAYFMLDNGEDCDILDAKGKIVWSSDDADIPNPWEI